MTDKKAEREYRRRVRRETRLFWVDAYLRDGLIQNSYQMARVAHAIGKLATEPRRCGVAAPYDFGRCTSVAGHTDGWHSVNGFLNFTA